MGRGTPEIRYAEVERETKETRVHVVLDLDEGTRQDISTGLGFFDHMLTLLAFHGSLNLGVKAEGDLHVDDHHTIEDVGIVMGKAIRESLRDTDPVVRYASNLSVMDEALVQIAIDISGRGMSFFDVNFKREKLGEVSTENIREFFRSLCLHAGITAHIRQIAGDNDHHISEAIFKGFGRALYEATRLTEGKSSNSTKGKID